MQRQPNWRASIDQILLGFDVAALWKMLLVILLMLVNWGIEARKWQLSLLQLQRISLLRSFKATLSGTTLAFFTPNRMGEYIGRVLYIKEDKRIQAVSLTIVCSMSQLLVTLLMGVIGILFIRHFLLSQQPDSDSVVFWLNTVIFTSLPAALLLGLLYFRLAWLVKWMEKISLLGKLLSYIRVLENFNATVLLRILSLSVMRYLVFVAQYYFLFQVFGVELNIWQVFWAVSVVFLVLAIVPTIALFTELGIRWKASIELVQLFSSNVVGILATSLSIWIINLVIPALIGSLLILSVRIFNNRDENNKSVPPEV